MPDLTKFTTEQRNQRSMDLDTMTSLQIVTTMNDEDASRRPVGHESAAPGCHSNRLGCWRHSSAAGASLHGRRHQRSSGRTRRFGVSAHVWRVTRPGLSGSLPEARRRLSRLSKVPKTARSLARATCGSVDSGQGSLSLAWRQSGRTPYVVGGLAYAKATGCKTIAIACNQGSKIGESAALAIEPVPGPEVLTGSTRLKAGTVQKLILNMISTGAMVRIGKVYQNLMVDVQQTNEKLVVRGQNIVMEATGCTRERAVQALTDAGGHVKPLLSRYCWTAMPSRPRWLLSGREAMSVLR